MNSALHTLGIVLGTVLYRDADIILRVLSPTLGKCAFLARGARRERSSLKHHFDMLDMGHFEFKQGRGSLGVVSFFKPAKGFLGIRESLDKIALASLLLESHDRLLSDSHAAHAPEEHGEIFENLDLSLSSINDAEQARESLRATYFGLGLIVKICGYGEPDPAVPPSARAMCALLDTIEQVTESPLLSKPSVLQIIQRLQKQHGVA